MATIINLPRNPNDVLLSQAAANLASGITEGRKQAKFKQALAQIDQAPDRTTAVSLLDNMDSEVTSDPQFFSMVMASLDTRFPTDLIEEPFYNAETGELVVKQRTPGSKPFSPADLDAENLTREAPTTYFLPTPEDPEAPITLLGDGKITKSQAEKLREEYLAENPGAADVPLFRAEDLNIALAAHNQIKTFKAKEGARQSSDSPEKFERQAMDELRRRNLEITSAGIDRGVNVIDKLPRAIQNADQLFTSSFGQGLEDILAVDSLGATAARDVVENSLFFGLDETDASRLGFVSGLVQSIEGAATESGGVEAREKFELQTGLKYDFYQEKVVEAINGDLQEFNPIALTKGEAKPQDMLLRIDNNNALILIEGQYIPVSVDTYNKFLTGSSIFAD